MNLVASASARISRWMLAISQRARDAPSPHIQFPASVRIQSPEETLSVVCELIKRRQPGAYLRFGDGDVNLPHGTSELLQPGDPRPAMEMAEAFSLTGRGIFKSLPIHCPRIGLEPGMRPGVHGATDEWAEALLARCFHQPGSTR